MVNIGGWCKWQCFTHINQTISYEIRPRSENIQNGDRGWMTLVEESLNPSQENHRKSMALLMLVKSPCLLLNSRFVLGETSIFINFPTDIAGQSTFFSIIFHQKQMRPTGLSTKHLLRSKGHLPRAAFLPQSCPRIESWPLELTGTVDL